MFLIEALFIATPRCMYLLLLLGKKNGSSHYMMCSTGISQTWVVFYSSMIQLREDARRLAQMIGFVPWWQEAKLKITNPLPFIKCRCFFFLFAYLLAPKSAFSYDSFFIDLRWAQRSRRRHVVLMNHKENSVFPAVGCLTNTSTVCLTATEELKHKVLLQTELPVLRGRCANLPAPPDRGWCQGKYGVISSLRGGGVCDSENSLGKHQQQLTDERVMFGGDSAHLPRSTCSEAEEGNERGCNKTLLVVVA